MTEGGSVNKGKPAVRFGRALASPIGVLITLPLLVVAVGLGILLVGRDATRTASTAMARRQLADQASGVQADVAFALDQAGPILERLRVLADRSRSVDDVLPRLHDLIIGRPGVSYLSISFDDGTFRGAYLGEQRRVEVQQSTLGASGTNVVRYVVKAGALEQFKTETTDYDPRKRGFYQLAEKTGARAWTEPYTFFHSFETGMTCTEPIYDANKHVIAVLTVDFDVGALSQYVARQPLEQARTIVYTSDGIILVYPDAQKLALPVGDKILRHEDLHDPALEALFKAAAGGGPQKFVELDGGGESYFASIAPIGGQRAGVAVPLDWYVATIVPSETLLGATHKLERSSVLASALALAIAVGLALVLAWNLVRMRRQVALSREEARSAEARARELGSYRLVARLGAGGMGEVWRAEHRLLARSAAIKLIRAEALRDPASVGEIRERFRREAQTLASMRSRHTIGIYDYGVTEAGVFYYVMELLDGLDFEALVMRDGPQPAARVIHLLIQACQSLAEAHDAGLLHRDIKPPNLFASRAAEEVDIVKLLDFGIVQAVSETPVAARISMPNILSMTESQELDAEEAESQKLTQVGAMLGTPGFMPPEQILGMQLDGRADLYALGCVAWWLLTGREVFERTGSEAKILHKHIYDAVPSLRERMRGWCPPELEMVIASCLAKEVDRRPATARALAVMLRAIPIPDEHAWTVERAQAWWAEYQAPEPTPSVSPSEIQVIMPGRTANQRQAEGTGRSVSDTVITAPTSRG